MADSRIKPPPTRPECARAAEVHAQIATSLLDSGQDDKAVAAAAVAMMWDRLSLNPIRSDDTYSDPRRNDGDSAYVSDVEH